MEKVYSINWDYNHSGDLERDAFHVPFENSNKASIMFLNPRYKDKLPRRVLFKANLETLRSIDYPLTDLNVPIFSKKMISVLNSVGKYEKILTPVVMIDDTYSDDFLNNNGEVKSEVTTNSDYSAVTIVNREDCFDYENSVYDPNELNPDIPGYIKTLVLRTNQALPPVFRINEAPSKLLITEFAKIALEANGVSGCVFEEVATF